ncbi:hypothetical protein T552_02371 [Pneumocystis carinii B80]|uniref:Uncharacterized protein n=1 Tax=Pneumocystis carinii (strain B80) TaxID=1408658 RepID=A0A0W4ZG90_PNEC8|nr:hypothetical protein T552_02371 [Pneumocystis carinii B80]KTW27392.1 hypothetical protein T552_02371 [Pneumocystis carinii B80]
MNLYQFNQNSRCGIDNCTSKQFYIDAGLTYCTNGHLVQGIIEIDNTINLNKNQPLRRRKVITTDKHKKKSKVLYGNEGKNLFLHCFQQILKTQVWCLIHTHGISRNLEPTVRNIWKIYLTLLTSNKLFQKNTKKNIKYHDVGNSNDNMSYKITKFPKLIDTISICYLGLLNLRSIITISTLYNFMKSGKVPYMQTSSIIPLEIRKCMEPHYQNILSPTVFPSYEKVLNATYSIFSAFYILYKIDFPPLNIYPILVTYIRGLYLPLELILPTLKLAYCLNISFTNRQLIHEKNLNTMPEVILLAILLISTRLYFQIDHYDIENLKDYAYNNLKDWSIWLATMNSQNYNKLTNINYTKTDINKISQISKEEIDNYLNDLSIQLSDSSYIKVPKFLLNIFPINELKKTNQCFNSTHNYYTLFESYNAKSYTSNTIFKSGKLIYKIFSLSSTLPNITKTLISKGAEMIGISEFKLRKIILILEKQYIYLNDNYKEESL